jgi:hypothetical protein
VDYFETLPQSLCVKINVGLDHGKSSVRTLCIPAEVRTEHHQSTKQEYHSLHIKVPNSFVVSTVCIITFLQTS